MKRAQEMPGPDHKADEGHRPDEEIGEDVSHARMLSLVVKALSRVAFGPSQPGGTAHVGSGVVLEGRDPPL